MRPLTDDEARLIDRLATGAGFAIQLRGLRVEPLLDGGMGSLRFASSAPEPRRARAIGACEFDDADGVLVTVELTVDQYGALFELDVWKVDSSPLIRWPLLQHVRIPASASFGSSS